MKIAIVGSGISGLGAAWLLSKQHEVTLFEKDARLGGHSNTVEVAGTPIDTGFIVYNARNYPNLVGLFKTLGVETVESNMSFSVTADAGRLEYAGTNLGTVFAQPKNLLSPSFLRMLRDILRFNRKGPQFLLSPREISLGAYLDELGMGQWFRTRYLLPMAGAIWSCPLETMLQYPAASFLQFFANHGLLTVNDQPQWYTVKGGSREYIKKLLADFKGEVRKDSGVASIRRDVDHVTITTKDGHSEEFDQVVLAVHGDQALPLLSDPDGREKRILGAFRYQPNRAVLHSDPRLMPKLKRVWSSWNYLATDEKKGLAVSYWMNKLQNLPPETDYFVTLNPPFEPEKIHYECHYDHPIFDEGTRLAQQQLPAIQGERRTWFCGAWTRYGFHEDGLLSAVKVAEKLGVNTPW